MERISRRERRAIQGARDRVMREKGCPTEFVCCGACDYVIKVYPEEDGPTKTCPRCGWTRHVVGGSWNLRDLDNVR